MRKTIFWVLAACLCSNAVSAADYKKGDRIEAQSNSAWYPATVVEAAPEKWKVAYDGYSSVLDEWVPAEKIRALRKAEWKTGDRVEALSTSRWYPAKIVESDSARWKVTYDGYSSSSDEWLNMDRLRVPEAQTAGGSVTAGKLVFPALPAGKVAGLEGAWLRVETFYWGSRLNLLNHGWFFTKDGRFSRAPTGGFNFKEFAAAASAQKTDGTYWIEGDKIFLQWADGAKTTEQSFTRKGADLMMGGLGATTVKGFKPGWRLDGEYEGGASLGGSMTSNTVVFLKDGTFSRSSVASISSTSDRSTVSASSQGQAAGTYAFDGYMLTLKESAGDVKKFTVFAFGDEDAAGRPLYIYREGTMMKRQK